MIRLLMLVMVIAVAFARRSRHFHPELNSNDHEEPANTEEEESSEERRRLIKQDIRRRLESTHMQEDGLSALLTQLQPYLQDMFNKADLGGVDGQSASDGLVTFDEIVSNVDGVDGSDADQALFNAVDADGDGQVTYQEFATFVQFYLMTQMHTAGGGNVTPAQIAESVRQLILSGR